MTASSSRKTNKRKSTVHFNVSDSSPLTSVTNNGSGEVEFQFMEEEELDDEGEGNVPLCSSVSVSRRIDAFKNSSQKIFGTNLNLLEIIRLNKNWSVDFKENCYKYHEPEENAPVDESNDG